VFGLWPVQLNMLETDLTKIQFYNENLHRLCLSCLLVTIIWLLMTSSVALGPSKIPNFIVCLCSGGSCSSCNGGGIHPAVGAREGSAFHHRTRLPGHTSAWTTTPLMISIQEWLAVAMVAATADYLHQIPQGFNYRGCNLVQNQIISTWSFIAYQCTECKDACSCFGFH